jgi:oxygen-independent coproporphyrinogen III oxidase
MNSTSFDPDLVRRHDRHGPRYTSYPTALQFHTRFDRSTYRRAALLSNATPAKPLSAYIHIPFCASPCFYCGCNKIITRDERHGTEYLRRLGLEIELHGRLFDRSRPVRQLHFGGGTPTFLTNEQLGGIFGQLRRYFTLDDSPQREISIEIDPRTVSAASFPALAALGFNRASLGVQDFDSRVQQAVNRRQSVAQVEEVLLQARAAGFRSISFDLIYGLPLQTVASFSRTLDTVIAMRPDRIAAYGYAHMPRMFKAQRAIDESQLPNAELRLQLLGLTIERLTRAGYLHIGMDHFALPEDELSEALQTGHLHRNFQGYSTRAECDLIGFGVSAIGSVGTVYAQNAKKLTDYYRALDSGHLPIERGVQLNTDDLARRDIIQRLMCQGVLDCRDIERQYALEFETYFTRELTSLREMAADGLLCIEGDKITVSDRGRFLLRTIAMAFDAYLGPAAEQRFSKVI